MGQIHLAMKHAIVYIQSIQLNENSSNYPPIYVPIKLRCNHEINVCTSHTHYIGGTGETSSCFSKREQVSRVNGPAGLLLKGLTVARVSLVLPGSAAASATNKHTDAILVIKLLADG